MLNERRLALAKMVSPEAAAALYPRAVSSRRRSPTAELPSHAVCMRFAETMTVSAETFQAIVLEVVASLKQHGIERFFVVDGHAGDQGALDVL
jgi:creatinine amidohydrolase